MLAIFRKSSVLYCTHLLTFSLIGLPLTFDQRGGVIPMMIMLIPVWISSSVLFSEREESYAFLRMLPAADEMIVRTKFALALLAILAYWLMMNFMAMLFSPGARFLAANLALVNLCCSFGLLLAAVWYICIWRLGVRVTAMVILTYMALNLVAAMILPFLAGRLTEPTPHGLLMVPILSESPWYGHALLLLLALAGYAALMQLGVRVKKMSEATS